MTGSGVFSPLDIGVGGGVHFGVLSDTGLFGVLGGRCWNGFWTQRKGGVSPRQLCVASLRSSL